MLPAREDTLICFAHPAYRVQDAFEKRRTGLRSFQVVSRDDLVRRLPEADVLVVSGFWRNDLLAQAPKLKFIQSISAGLDQYGRDGIRERGIRLASAQGVNERAVSEHAMALILALARKLPEARDNQIKHIFRPMIGDPAARENEMGGKTLVIIGLGRIGGRLARIAKAFDMRVIGVRRDPQAGRNGADAVYSIGDLRSLLPQADIVALTCPLTPETENLINAETLGLMKPTAQLVNAARGRCVDARALFEALHHGTIAAAALDTFADEPLAAESPLWDLPNLLITPHTAGDTQLYEDNVVDILIENLDRLWRGETSLRNGVI